MLRVRGCKVARFYRLPSNAAKIGSREAFLADAETDAELTHVDAEGAARMVDVSGKAVSVREAEARGTVWMRADTIRLLRDGASKKGDVLGVARIAGIMGAKRTSELIPLCHQIPLSSVTVDFAVEEEGSALQITARTKSESTTGVEMEALTAVSVAALTVYDMCKAVDRGMRVGNIRLTRKSGGKTGLYEAE
jgi:cyclic pyranopterin phosphate synthase